MSKYASLTRKVIERRACFYFCIHRVYNPDGKKRGDDDAAALSLSRYQVSIWMGCDRNLHMFRVRFATPWDSRTVLLWKVQYNLLHQPATRCSRYCNSVRSSSPQLPSCRGEQGTLFREGRGDL